APNRDKPAPQFERRTLDECNKLRGELLPTGCVLALKKSPPLPRLLPPSLFWLLFPALDLTDLMATAAWADDSSWPSQPHHVFVADLQITEIADGLIQGPWRKNFSLHASSIATESCWF